MYCDFAGCICIVCYQIEGACQDCELRDPGRYLQENVYQLAPVQTAQLPDAEPEEVI